MSEKVLGLKLGKHVPVGWTNSKKQSIGVEVLTIKGKRILETVSVRLASESVDLKWLKEWCKRNMAAKFTDEDGNCGEDVVYIDDLIEWAEKEAKK